MDPLEPPERDGEEQSVPCPPRRRTGPCTRRCRLPNWDRSWADWTATPAPPRPQPARFATSMFSPSRVEARGARAADGPASRRPRSRRSGCTRWPSGPCRTPPGTPENWLWTFTRTSWRIPASFNPLRSRVYDATTTLHIPCVRSRAQSLSIDVMERMIDDLPTVVSVKAEGGIRRSAASWRCVAGPWGVEAGHTPSTAPGRYRRRYRPRYRRCRRRAASTSVMAWITFPPRSSRSGLSRRNARRRQEGTRWAGSKTR